MDLRTASPYWLMKDGYVQSFPRLEEDLNVEVVIVGAGITGALIAHEMASAGVEVAMLERTHPGMGSTAATTALLQYEIDTELFKLVDRYGKAKAFRAYQLCSEAIDELEKLATKLQHAELSAHESGTKLDNSFRRKKSLYLASKKSDLLDLHRELQVRREAGLRLEAVDRDQLASEYAVEAPGALISQQGAEANAYALCHQLLASLRRQRVPIFSQTEVASIEEGPRSIVLKTASKSNDSGFKVQAKYCVMANGYESQRDLPKGLVRLHSTFAAISEPSSEAPKCLNDCLLWESARPYLYMRTTPDRRILIGGKDEPFQNAKKRDALLSQKTRALETSFEKKFPHLRFRTDYAWAGTFAETKDGLPYIGALPQNKRKLFALGFGGNGITFSVIAARLLCDRVRGRNNADAKVFDFAGRCEIE